MDKNFILGSISIVLALITIAVGTDNVWNSPNFDIKINDVSKKVKGQTPVDELVRAIYDERNLDRLDSGWIYNQTDNSLQLLKQNFSAEDAWILDRIYYNRNVDGLSQKVIIVNNGNRQAHDVIIQISGTNNFRITEYNCPEIMSDKQIVKEFGKKYIISASRMSTKLECSITINSVGNEGIDRIIVTADESNSRVWPDDSINALRTYSTIGLILIYVSIGLIAIVSLYNIVRIYEKRKKKINHSAIK